MVIFSAKHNNPSPAGNAEEAEFYLSKELVAKHRLNEELWRSVFQGVLNTVEIIADDLLIQAESKAKAGIAFPR